MNTKIFISIRWKLLLIFTFLFMIVFAGSYQWSYYFQTNLVPYHYENDG